MLVIRSSGRRLLAHRSGIGDYVDEEALDGHPRKYRPAAEQQQTAERECVCGDDPLPAGDSRRRVAGLRREKVATLAGISAEYDVRLKSGNVSGASESVLDGVATPCGSLTTSLCTRALRACLREDVETLYGPAERNDCGVSSSPAAPSSGTSAARSGGSRPPWTTRRPRRPREGARMAEGQARVRTPGLNRLSYRKQISTANPPTQRW